MALQRLRRTLCEVGSIYVFVTVSDAVTATRRTPNVDTVSNEMIDREKSAWAVGFVWLRFRALDFEQVNWMCPIWVAAATAVIVAAAILNSF